MGNNKYKILIVEDDQSILGFVQTILETNGYQVLTAERCRQGLLIFSSYTPDLVVLDLGLPDMDGGEFIRQVRLFSTVPISSCPPGRRRTTRSPRWIWAPTTT